MPEMTREEYLGKCDARAEPKSRAEWERIGQSIANEVMREKRDAAVALSTSVLLEKGREEVKGGTVR